jgi:hypothetical protein
VSRGGALGRIKADNDLLRFVHWTATFQIFSVLRLLHRYFMAITKWSNANDGQLRGLVFAGAWMNVQITAVFLIHFVSSNYRLFIVLGIYFHLI